MNLRWRLAGAVNKPPYGAVAKSYGITQQEKTITPNPATTVANSKKK